MYIWSKLDDWNVVTLYEEILTITLFLNKYGTGKLSHSD